MTITLTESEAEWLEMLLIVHEGEICDTILKRIAEARMGEALCKKPECKHHHTKARSNLYREDELEIAAEYYVTNPTKQCLSGSEA